MAALWGLATIWTWILVVVSLLLAVVILGYALHERLSVLRTAVRNAYEPVRAELERRHELAAEWNDDGVRDALEAVRGAAGKAETDPSDAEALRTLARARATLDAALAGAPEELRKRVEANGRRVAFAAEAFTEAAEAYEEARNRPGFRWIARRFGFRNAPAWEEA